MAEFGNTLFEGGIAPEVQRQAPVEDNSGAMLAESLGGAFQTAGSIFGQMIKGGQEADTNRILSDYRQEVVRIANAVDQGSLKAGAARTHVRAKYLEYISNNPALAEEFDGINSKLLSDRGLAGVIQDKSPEEKARDSIIENAMTNGWVTSNTPEGVEQGVTNMLSFKAAENRVNAVAQELRLVQSRNGIVSEQQKFRAQQATLELAQTGYPWAQAQIAKAQQLIQQGGDVGEVLTMTKNDINSRLSQIQILSEGSDIAWVTKPFERLLTAFEDSVTGKTTTEVYEARAKQIKAQQDLAMRTDPEFGPIIAISEALGHNGATENLANQAAIKYLTQLKPATNEDGSPTDNDTANLIKKDIDTGQAIEAIRGDITSIVNTGNPTDKQKQEINTLITNHFRSLAEHYPSARDASDFQKWIEFVSDPTIGNWIAGEMNGAIPAETQQIVSEVIRGQYEDVLLPLVRQTLEEVPYIVNFTPGGEMGAFGGITIGGQINREEAISMFWNGMGVEFRAADGYATNPAVRAKVEDLNRGANSVAKPLNTLIRAQAHIAGHNNYQETWAQLEPRLFPEMAQETEEGAGAPSLTNFNPASPDASVAPGEAFEEEAYEEVSLKDFNPQELVQGASSSPTPEQTSLLDFIGNKEAPKGYSQIYGGSKLKPPKPLEQMTVGEVREFQDKMVSNGSASSAVGRYQFIRKTLDGLIEKGVVSPTDVFDKATQDKLARGLLTVRGYNSWLSGKLSDEEFANNLAKEWASMPVVSGANLGKSYYDGDGLNKSLTSPEEFLSVIKRMKGSGNG